MRELPAALGRMPRGGCSPEDPITFNFLWATQPNVSIPKLLLILILQIPVSHEDPGE